ncbi:MAG: hypothetical protein IJ743_01825 [Bacilli bacterium]|nr:hypothetical protein [Bacilli bacterium]MBR1748516.1 hypothetical protein [Bacilli bacterium]MBR1817984.1 hypothetical protein [Bacilli bacterium]
MNEEYDIIDIDGEEYAIVEEFDLEENHYALICRLLENDEPSEEAEVVKMVDDEIYSIEEEHEKNLIKDYLEGKIQELENEE